MSMSTTDKSVAPERAELSDEWKRRMANPAPVERLVAAHRDFVEKARKAELSERAENEKRWAAVSQARVR